jgi:hypothetical protein
MLVWIPSMLVWIPSMLVWIGVDKTFLNVYAARHHRIAPHWLPGIAA